MTSRFLKGVDARLAAEAVRRAALPAARCCWRRLTAIASDREQRAAASNGAPDGVRQVREALFELVDQVVDEPGYT